MTSKIEAAFYAVLIILAVLFGYSIFMKLLHFISYLVFAVIVIGGGYFAYKLMLKK
jgi:hypothetical protein